MSIDTGTLKQLIQRNLKEIHTIEDMAQRIHSSTETVRKDFWRDERVSLGDFILNCKVDEAKRLLVETDLLCKEICLEAGFRREDTGAAIFKRRTGMSISEFRKKHRDHR